MSEKEFDVHNRERTYRRALAALETAEIGEDRQLIKDFLHDEGASGIGHNRQTKYAYFLIQLRKWLGTPFKKATEADLKELVNEHLENGKYAAWTRRDFKVSLIKFYRWLGKLEKGTRPPILKFMDTRLKSRETKLPEQLITEEEARALIAAGRNAREKALIAVLYESAARIAEFLNLRIRDAAFDKNGAILSITHGKTGARRIRIVFSAPYLREWLEYHPQKEKPAAPLWPSKRAGYAAPITYEMANKIIRGIAARAGIKKPVNPHAFRHARLTYLAKKLTDAQLKQFAGWTQASSMAAVYVHLSGRDTDEAILGIYGLTDSKKDEAPRLKVCPLCRMPNAPEAQHCINKACGVLLDAGAWRDEQEKEREKREALYLLVKELELRLNAMQGPRRAKPAAQPL